MTISLDDFRKEDLADAITWLIPICEDLHSQTAGDDYPFVEMIEDVVGVPGGSGGRAAAVIFAFIHEIWKEEDYRDEGETPSQDEEEEWDDINRRVFGVDKFNRKN